MNGTVKSLNLAVLALIFSISASLAIPTGLATAEAQAECGNSYRVKRGDTLGKIARRCGTTISNLMMANPQIKNPNLIYTGRTLQIPGRATSDGSTALTHVIRPKEDALSPAEMAQIGIDKNSRERWIDIDLSSQTVSAYEGQELMRTFLVSTGTWRTPTVTGRYRIYSKYRFKDMRGPGYFLRDVPYTMFFHKGYALHGTYWHANFGTPMSHGCVNLDTEDAAWLYDFASIKTMVHVHP